MERFRRVISVFQQNADPCDERAHVQSEYFYNMTHIAAIDYLIDSETTSLVKNLQLYDAPCNSNHWI